MASSQAEKDGLLVSLELVDWIGSSFYTKPSLPLCPVLVVDDGFCFSVGHFVAGLLHFAAGLGECVSLFVSIDPTVCWNPL